METRNAKLATAGISCPDIAPVLQQARAGDRAAFRQIVVSFQARIFSVALRLTGQRTDAEELAQDTFIQLHAALARITDAGHLEKWLLRAIYHRSIDRLRQHGRQGLKLPLDALGEGPEAHIAETGADPLAAARLGQLMLQLQPDARAVLLLRYQEDLDPVDIAAVLDMPLNTVKSHLRRSLQWLRDRCAGEADGY